MFASKKSAKQENATKQKFVAHRGANNEVPGSTLPHFPENTLPALLEAYKQQATFVECDIHLTQDNQIIVLHDYTLRRTAKYNSKLATSLSENEFKEILDIDVSKLSYKKHIGQVDVGLYSDELSKKFIGTQVPLLSDYFDQLDGLSNKKLIIELKATNYKVIDFLTLVIKRYKLTYDQLLFISFDFDLIKLSKQVLPAYKHLFLTVAKQEIKRVPMIEYKCIQTIDDLKEVMDHAKAAKLDGLYLECHNSLESFIPIIKKNNLLAGVWNYPIDDNVTMANRMLEVGADFINTNQPEWMFKWFFEQTTMPQISRVSITNPCVIF